MSMLTRNFKKNLRSFLSGSELTQVDLANRCKYSKARVTQILNHDDNLTCETMERIARALGMSVYDLIKKPEK